MAPPQTRGSTPHPAFPPRGAAGSPADAGIDPAPSARPIWTARLPRRRGDRPAPRRVLDHLLSAPPQTRGSTRLLTSPGSRPRGSPADAGIDPFRARCLARSSGLPRRRGDRPARAHERGRIAAAPPQTRGSTRDGVQRRLRHRGSPADAGIDPDRLDRPPPVPGLPRRRGDRPSTPAAEVVPRTAPPQTRGSTQGRPLDRPRRDGSPADAGIDPCCTA